jgi:hypothetical protein
MLNRKKCEENDHFPFKVLSHHFLGDTKDEVRTLSQNKYLL